MTIRSVLMFCVLASVAGAQALTPYEQANLEKNRAWVDSRDRVGQEGDIGVFADAGVWHAGAQALVGSLEGGGTRCRVLLAPSLTRARLSGLRVLLLPGGYAPYQWGAAGQSGLDAIREFAEGGGTVVGICAGAYLISKTVRYDGIEYPYPLGLFDGVAQGPVPGLAAYPQVGPASLQPTKAGRDLGLGALEGRRYAYGGGPCFVGGTGVEVLATYADGSAAVVRRTVGKGRIVATGVHFERPAPEDGDVETAPPPDEADEIYRALMGR